MVMRYVIISNTFFHVTRVPSLKNKTYTTISDMVKMICKKRFLYLQDNSRNEWAFQKAITIQTYRNYHPIPVPFNTISIVAMEVIRVLKKSEKGNKTEESQRNQVSLQ